MPFTLSHPAAIAALWPLAGRARIPLAALVLGAMVPDFEYFLHMRPLALWGHSLAGLFVFCLPVGLVSLAAWEYVMRDWTRRMLGFEPDTREPRTLIWWALAAAGIVIGAATHVAWDGLTHVGRWGEALVPALARPAFALRGFAIPWLVVLDYASTAIGGIVVLVWMARPWIRSGAARVWSRSAWRLLMTAAVGVLGAVVGLVNLGRMVAANTGRGFFELEVLVGRLAVGTMLGIGVALLIFSGSYRAWRHWVPARTPEAYATRRERRTAQRKSSR